MTKTKSLYLPIALAAMLTTACSKKNGSSKNGNEAQVSYTVSGNGQTNGGVQFSGQGIAGVDNGTTTIIITETASSTGGSTTFKNKLAILITGTKTGTYPLTEDFDAKNNISLAAGSTSYVNGQDGSSGTLTITKFEKYGGLIEGTFSGTFVVDETDNKVSITNGHFVCPHNEPDTH